MPKKPRIPRTESPAALARMLRNKHRRELYAINKERKIEREQLKQFVSGDFRPGDPNNQTWDPDRWIFDGKIPGGILADGVAQNIQGRNVRIAYIVDAPSQVGYGKSESGGSTVAVGTWTNKAGFIRDLEAGRSFPRLVEEFMGWPRGTVERVLEVSIAESSQ